MPLVSGPAPIAHIAILTDFAAAEAHKAPNAPRGVQRPNTIAASGVYQDLLLAGARMLEPICDPCVGMGQAPPSGAVSVRTFNRNFPGRSGTADDKVYLCSPTTAAATALCGVITDPRKGGAAPERVLDHCAGLRRRLDAGTRWRRDRRNRAREAEDALLTAAGTLAAAATMT